MKIYRFFLAFLMIIPLLQACQADITDLEDPRDAITKDWEVVEDGYPGGNSYYVTIINHPTESTQIVFSGEDGFHGLKTMPEVYGTLAGLNIDIPEQSAEGYTFKGTGVISSNYKNITFDYSVTTLDGTDEFHAVYGPINTAKKKAVTVKLPVQ